MRHIDKARWYSVWEIRDAFVSIDRKIPLRDNPPTISVLGEYWTFDEVLEGGGNLFHEVDNKMVDDPGDLHIKIKFIPDASDEESFVQFVPDNHGDYGKGTSEIHLFVDSLEFALLADVFTESHRRYVVCVSQESPAYYEDDLGYGPITHVDVGNKCKIKVVEFSAFRRDEKEE